MSNTSRRPEKRTDEIHEVITSVNRYNVKNIPLLEEYVKSQCNSYSASSNDLQANLALLKLYQFNPELLNLDVVLNILVKALTTLPGNEFIMCMYLLNEQLLNDDMLVKLLELKEMLETARFEGFWDMVLNDPQAKELTDGVKGFEDSIRTMIADTVSLAHQSASSEFLMAALNLDESDLQEFAEQQSWEIKHDGLVVLPLHKENVAKSTVNSEQVQFEHLTKIIGSASEI
ncbi:hypothetical protein BB561_004216 [Smittium simulii]|uniref:Eukaryotic translation initiation factor 3 subunit K n=1 Tax=Smittium simulii TaxID=133385 RepID=A0A2T9YHG5_9FUNG|nr:hypothetical protein BB561_004216 [Smittium simulii]